MMKMKWIFLTLLILSSTSFAQNKKTSTSSKCKKVFHPNNEDIEKVREAILEMIEKTLIPPRMIDLKRYVGISENKLKTILSPEFKKEFWNQVKKNNPNYFEKLKQEIAKAFIRSIKDSESIEWKNKTPDVERLYEQYILPDSKLINSKSDIYPNIVKTKLHLDFMLGKKYPKKRNEIVPPPILFPKGMSEVELLAKKISPSSNFKYYTDTAQFSLKKDKEIAQLILKSKGAIISSVTSKIPTNKDFFQNILAYSKDKGFPIILLPTNGEVSEIDPYLLDMPDQVYIPTHTIEFSNFLRIWNIPIMPKNENPFASLNNFLQGKRAQVQIVGSPQQRHTNVPTAKNDVISHALWAPGSVSENLYPTSNPPSLRVSETASNRHAYGFLVLEMTDKLAGTNKKGVPDMFHIRPVKYFDHKKYDGISGFVDLNQLYTEGKKQETNIEAMVVGDIHDHHTSQVLLKVYEEVIRDYKVNILVLHDVLDGNSHNHHESKQLNLSLDKFKRGDLNIKTEVEGVIQTLNAFLEKFPHLQIIINDSNHNYWLENLLDNPNAIVDMENREFILELLNIRNNFDIKNIYRYLLGHHREEFHKRLEPRFKHQKLKDNIYIVDPSRVKVMDKGEPFILGPDHNPVHLNFHGHKGANGARGSMPSHSRATHQMVVGDSHQTGILGGTVNVGTSTYKQLPYTLGGYSSWSNGFALINDEGTVQLITVEPITNESWKQNPSNGFLPESAQSNPVVKLTDNEILPDVKIIDQYSQKPSKKK